MLARLHHLHIVPLLGAALKGLKRRLDCPLPDLPEHFGRLEPERRLIELAVLDDTALRHMRLKKDALQQPRQVRHRRGRRGGAALLTVDALEQCLRCDFVERGNGLRHA